MVGRFVSTAQELDMPIKCLTSALGVYSGSPYNYWHLRVNYPALEGWEQNWDLMPSGGYAAIGWPNLGDLSRFRHNLASGRHLSELMKEKYDDSTDWTNQVFSFACRISEEDLILAIKFDQLVGIGRVISDYLYYDSEESIPHRRHVEWLWQGNCSGPLDLDTPYSEG